MRRINRLTVATEVDENPLNDRRRFDAGDDVQGCTNSAERRDARICIENICDFNHLPFVHKTTIGLFKQGWVMDVRLQNVPDGVRAA